jgi:hypothetical protein
MGWCWWNKIPRAGMHALLVAIACSMGLRAALGGEWLGEEAGGKSAEGCTFLISARGESRARSRVGRAKLPLSRALPREPLGWSLALPLRRFRHGLLWFVPGDWVGIAPGHRRAAMRRGEAEGQACKRSVSVNTTTLKKG